MSQHRAERTPATRRADRRRHAAPRPTRSSGLLKALVGVGALATAGVLAFGGQGTFAYWTDTATVTGTGFTSGTLDLTVDQQQGTPTAYAKSELTMSAMVPGESAAAAMTLRNVGNADFRWTPTVSTSGPLAGALVVDLYLGGAVTGSATGYPRQQGCSGTLLTTGTATRLNIGSVGQTGQTLCAKVTLPTSVGDGLQNQTVASSVSIVINASQVLP